MEISRVLILKYHSLTYAILERLIVKHAQLTLVQRWKLIIEAVYSMGNYTHDLSPSFKVRNLLLYTIGRCLDKAIDSKKLLLQLKAINKFVVAELSTLTTIDNSAIISYFGFDTGILERKLDQDLKLEIVLYYHSASEHTETQLTTILRRPTLLSLYELFSSSFDFKLKPVEVKLDTCRLYISIENDGE